MAKKRGSNRARPTKRIIKKRSLTTPRVLSKQNNLKRAFSETLVYRLPEPVRVHLAQPKNTNKRVTTPATVFTGVPRDTLKSFNQKVCRNRKLRRQVIFARNLQKKGSGAKRHKQRTDSKVSCRR